MNVFFDVDDTAINLSKVKEIGIAGEKALKISFDDGTSQICEVYDSAEKAAERFKKFVVHIIPCAAPFYNVYKNNDGGYSHERVYFLAMCADGAVRSFAHPKYNCTMDMNLADENDSFIGYFNENELIKYPITTKKEA